MTLTETKKLLYKENPKAQFDYIRQGKAYYHSDTTEGIVNFEIPVSDMGSADFFPEMESKFLNRWIVSYTV